ncbi:uncharacterized protein AMSG_01087 [Thecamonas trahens ATCC 50062]|uniref:Uncharacterized protein n=1 Tax=Thecamonas trahens ATCC 50062 TaxID=461836 RepID=A0A0L0DLI3_THETB|nr:hypothetical protein AMSG_01087 [Thecamonas trahens ATCC 50062]KNC52258.1 hypothetical protein AMSG_01087 [Thecamonas trahens ATCC 50062]|eukprot:XP_013762260.1 hypothetical protein AMSG_01087 [Thecamonas trahens ATCC 50062]
MSGELHRALQREAALVRDMTAYENKLDKVVQKLEALEAEHAGCQARVESDSKALEAALARERVLRASIERMQEEMVRVRGELAAAQAQVVARRSDEPATVDKGEARAEEEQQALQATATEMAVVLEELALVRAERDGYRQQLDRMIKVLHCQQGVISARTQAFAGAVLAPGAAGTLDASALHVGDVSQVLKVLQAQLDATAEFV